MSDRLNHQHPKFDKIQFLHLAYGLETGQTTSFHFQLTKLHGYLQHLHNNIHFQQ